MTSTSRRKDIVWLNCEEVKSDIRKGCRAKCKKYKKEMEEQVIRMKKHVETCSNVEEAISVSNNESIGK